MRRVVAGALVLVVVAAACSDTSDSGAAQPDPPPAAEVTRVLELGDLETNDGARGALRRERVIALEGFTGVVRTAELLVRVAEEPVKPRVVPLEPVRSLEFVLEDANGKQFTFGIDVAPVNPDVRSPFFYARTKGSTDICVIDRRTFELLDAALVKETSPSPDTLPPLLRPAPPINGVE